MRRQDVFCNLLALVRLASRYAPRATISTLRPSRPWSIPSTRSLSGATSGFAVEDADLGTVLQHGLQVTAGRACRLLGCWSSPGMNGLSSPGMSLSMRTTFTPVAIALSSVFATDGIDGRDGNALHSLRHHVLDESDSAIDVVVVLALPVNRFNIRDDPCPMPLRHLPSSRNRERGTW